jgi:hypothetical protein
MLLVAVVDAVDDDAAALPIAVAASNTALSRLSLRSPLLVVVAVVVVVVVVVIVDGGAATAAVVVVGSIGTSDAVLFLFDGNAEDDTLFVVLLSSSFIVSKDKQKSIKDSMVNLETRTPPIAST